MPVSVLVGQVLQAQSTRDVRRERGRGRGLCWTHSEGGEWATRGWNELGRTLLLLLLGPLFRQGCVREMRLKNEWLSLGDCKKEKRHVKLISASPGHTDPGGPLAARTLDDGCDPHGREAGLLGSSETEPEDAALGQPGGKQVGRDPVGIPSAERRRRELGRERAQAGRARQRGAGRSCAAAPGSRLGELPPG